MPTARPHPLRLEVFFLARTLRFWQNLKWLQSTVRAFGPGPAGFIMCVDSISVAVWRCPQPSILSSYPRTGTALCPAGHCPQACLWPGPPDVAADMNCSAWWLCHPAPPTKHQPPPPADLCQFLSFSKHCLVSNLLFPLPSLSRSPVLSALMRPHRRPASSPHLTISPNATPLGKPAAPRLHPSPAICACVTRWEGMRLHD